MSRVLIACVHDLAVSEIEGRRVALMTTHSMVSMLMSSCLLLLLLASAMTLHQPSSLAMARAWQHQQSPASSLPRLAAARRHHSSRMTAARHNNFFVAASSSLRTRALAPQMRLQTELVAAAAAVAINPAFVALDGLAVLLKIGWRLGVAAVLWTFLKPTIMDILRSSGLIRFVDKLQANPNQFRIVLFIVLAPIARRLSRKVMKLFGVSTYPMSVKAKMKQAKK